MKRRTLLTYLAIVASILLAFYSNNSAKKRKQANEEKVEEPASSVGLSKEMLPDDKATFTKESFNQEAQQEEVPPTQVGKKLSDEQVRDLKLQNYEDYLRYEQSIERQSAGKLPYKKPETESEKSELIKDRFKDRLVEKLEANGQRPGVDQRQVPPTEELVGQPPGP